MGSEEMDWECPKFYNGQFYRKEWAETDVQLSKFDRNVLLDCLGLDRCPNVQARKKSKEEFLLELWLSLGTKGCNST